MRAIDVPTVFRGFDDYWSPFLGGQGPVPSYAMALTEERRGALRGRIRATLPAADNGSVHLIAHVWAARGLSPSTNARQLLRASAGDLAGSQTHAVPL